MVERIGDKVLSQNLYSRPLEIKNKIPMFLLLTFIENILRIISTLSRIPIPTQNLTQTMHPHVIFHYILSFWAVKNIQMIHNLFNYYTKATMKILIIKYQ